MNRFSLSVRCFLFLSLLSTSALNVGGVAADDAQPIESPKIKSLFIALESYSGAPLVYVDNDLNELQKALVFFSGETKIIYDGSRSETYSPKRQFEKDFEDWRSRLRPDETALLYLSGHGVQNPETKQLYIPMLNFLDEPADRRFESAAVPFSWLREQFEKANCKHRVVFIDACHAGAASRSLGEARVDYASPLREFVDATSKNVAASSVSVLASSSDSQKSWIWERQKQSLFTYWLVKGLKGYADADDDFQLTLEELERYVTERVERVSKAEIGMELQTPTLHNARANASFALPRQARKKNDAIKYCAEFLDGKLRSLAQAQGKDADSPLYVALEPAFKTGPGGDQIDATLYGTAPQLLSAALLSELSSGDVERPYVVVETPSELAQATDAELLNNDVEATISGRIFRLSPKTLSLRLTLTPLKKTSRSLKNTPSVVSEKIWLTSDDYATLGEAFQLADAPNDKFAVVGEAPVALEAPEIAENETLVLDPDAGGAVALPEYQAAETIEKQRQEQINPVDDETSPFKIQIYVKNSAGKYEPRPGKTVDGKHYVPLDLDETFAVRLRNDYPDADGCYLRLFVDGLNTVAYRSRAAGSRALASGADKIAALSNALVSEYSLRVDDVETASRWYLPRRGETQINGFTLKTRGVQASTVVPFALEEYSSGSFVATQNVDDRKIGIITAIFSVPKRSLSLSDYEPKLGRRADGPPSAIAAQIVPASPTYRYRWERRKATESEWSPVAGQTGAVYPLSDDDIGCFLRVVVRGEDSQFGEISAETQKPVVAARSLRYSVKPNAAEAFVVNLQEAEVLEDQTRATFQIYRLSPEDFQRLTEKN